MIALAAAGGAGAALALSLIRFFAGPTVYDRALAVNTIVVKIALICAAVSVAANQVEWLDVTFGFVFSLVVLNAAALKLFRLRTFQPPLTRDAENA